jgi:hypothetical protein
VFKTVRWFPLFYEFVAVKPQDTNDPESVLRKREIQPDSSTRLVNK